MINNRTYQTLSVVAATLACVTGISADALAVPALEAESLSGNLERSHSSISNELIHDLTIQPWPDTLPALKSDAMVDALAPETLALDKSKNAPVAPVTATPPVATVEHVAPVSHNAADLNALEPMPSITQNEQLAALLAQAETTTPTVAPAANPFVRKDGFYVMFYGVPVQGRDRAQDFIGRATFDIGFGFAGGLGYRAGDFRFDAEVQYFKNNFKDLFFFIPGTTTVAPGQPEQSPDAFVNGRAVMFNLYYDVPIASLPRFRPYVGAGIGFYTAFINDLSPPGFGGFVANGTSPNRFAYQLRAGFNYAITSQLDFFTGYRFFKGNRFEYTIENSGTPPLVLQPNGLKSHSWEIGLRYVF
jgi:opacity protein-like surface antigen